MIMKFGKKIAILATMALAAVLTLPVTTVKTSTGLEVRDLFIDGVSSKEKVVKKATHVADGKISDVRIQITRETNLSRDVRFIAAIDSYEYEEAGFIFKAMDKEVTVIVTKAYQGVLADDITILPSEFGNDYNYFIAYAISEVPVTAYNEDLSITAFVKVAVEDEPIVSGERQTTVQTIIDIENTVENNQSIQRVIDRAAPGNTIYLKAGTYDQALNINVDNLTLLGIADEGEEVLLTNKLYITGENVTLQNLNFKFTYENSNSTSLYTGSKFPGENAPIWSTEELTLIDCNVERISELPQSFGILVQGNKGLNATGTTFIAPCGNNMDKVRETALSVLETKSGEIYLDNCIIETNGYALFDFHVTKGLIENTTFRGIKGEDGKYGPILSVMNCTQLKGLIFDNCNFTTTTSNNSTFVIAGDITIKNSTFDNPTNNPNYNPNDENSSKTVQRRYASIYGGEVKFLNNSLKMYENSRGFHFTSFAQKIEDIVLQDIGIITIEGNVFENIAKTDNSVAICHFYETWGYKETPDASILTKVPLEKIKELFKNNTFNDYKIAETNWDGGITRTIPVN